MVDAELIQLFQTIGLSEQKAKETLKNANVTKNLKAALSNVEQPENLKPGVGVLLYHMASKIKPQIADKLAFLTRYIVEGKLDTNLRVEAALEYLLSNQRTKDATVNVQEFERECGVGVVVTPEEIETVVLQTIQKHKSELLLHRYKYNSFKILQEVRQLLKWADANSIKAAIDVEILDILGPKTDADMQPQAKTNKEAKNIKKEAAPAVKSKGKEEISDGAQTIAELMKTKVHFHAPGENYKTDGYQMTENTNKLLLQHLRETGGRVQTRFPPEPNGILHIGHAKAININFGYAAAHNGVCYLRFDDTNPEKEEEKFVTGIKDAVEWLGYKPYKITYSSDYFQQLYEWAVVLIEKGLAYVCHQSAEDMKGFDAKPSVWRDRPIEESLQLFQDMKRGKIDEGAATLRMKLTLEEGKLDPVAYRIKFVEHHRTGKKWCIYPTYDYTHCLCDSIENITHSLCTKEFQSRRSSYYWLCNALDIYCPVQWEYGRLNMNYALVSKRKILYLINHEVVSDWDDPRLFTLTGLRRRGYPAEAINNFCARMGVTGATISVDPSMLEAAVRDVLNVTAARHLVVLRPIKIKLYNFPFDGPQILEVPNFPNEPKRGTHQIVLDREIYIDFSDFNSTLEKGFRRLAPGQPVGLRHAGLVITYQDFWNDPVTGELVLLCSCESTEKVEKPQGFIHWVSQAIDVEVRVFEQLFKSKNPEEVPGGYIADLNPNSLQTFTAKADRSLRDLVVGDCVQFERVGFFCVDPDTTKDKMVLNRTVGLKEDAGKK